MREYSREWIADTDIRFGHRMKSERIRQGMAQQHVLTTLETLHGIRWHQSTVTKVEAGARPVRLHEALAIASILAVRLGELIDEPDRSEERGLQTIRGRARLYELEGIHRHLDSRRKRLEVMLDDPDAGERGDDGEHREAP